MTFSIVRTAAFHARGSHVSPSFAQYVRLTTHKIQHGARRPNPTNIIVANRRDLEAKWSQGLKQQRDTLSKEIQKAKCSLSKRIEGGYAVLVKQSDDFIKQRERESQELLKNLDLKEQHLEEAIENGIKEIRRLDVGSYIYLVVMGFSNFIIGLTSHRINREGAMGGKFQCSRRNRYISG